jgi:hypothetical protein
MAALTRGFARRLEKPGNDLDFKPASCNIGAEPKKRPAGVVPAGQIMNH